MSSDADRTPPPARESPLWLAGVALLASLFVGAFTVDLAGGDASSELVVGEVADRTVRATRTFSYTDFAGRDEAAVTAKDAVSPVYVYRTELQDDLQRRVSEAFAAGRGHPTDRDAAGRAFAEALGLHLPEEDAAALFAATYPAEAEALSRRLIARAMSGVVIADRADLPPEGVPIAVLELSAGGVTEHPPVARGEIRTPAEAREQVTMALLEAKPPAAPWVDAAAGVARASVRPNLSYDARETLRRQQDAAAAVEPTVVTVKRGAILFRQGDVIDATDVTEYSALRGSSRGRGPWSEWIAASAFMGLLVSVAWSYGSARFADFSTKVRDAAAAAVLLVATAAGARAVSATSDGLAALIGMDVDPKSLAFALPVGGAVMLVRLLLGPSWAMLFALASAAACGIVMELDAVRVMYFVAVGLFAASTVDHTRERMSIVWAGAYTALLAAVTALLAHLVDVLVIGGDVGLDLTIRPVWSMGFAAVGGVLSAFVALALLPLFETAGFVTDYRLMELANLNHPLLRQLMLRAPGSYHHSVVVGTLAEAACEAIGANALQARVAAYFHDIGKASKPQYFVENQRGAANRHDTMEPFTSAKIILAHVIDGGRMAREHGLPKPIVDNIYMHHGTGILQYFYDRAKQDANGEPVDEALFRYPGPRPDTREAGVIMLADKVEAATRTIREPSEEAFRTMIHQIINSVMADGQFDACPLTFKEIHTIAETFVKVLLGIHHQRVEYPQTAAISRGNTAATDADDPAARRRGSVITLELPSPKRAESARTGTDGGGPVDDVTDPDTDYESLQNLPKRR